MMRDEAGEEYKIAHSMLGFDNREAYLGYYKHGTKLGSLTYKYIETNVNKR